MQSRGRVAHDLTEMLVIVTCAMFSDQVKLVGSLSALRKCLGV